MEFNNGRSTKFSAPQTYEPELTTSTNQPSGAKKSSKSKNILWVIGAIFILFLAFHSRPENTSSKNDTPSVSSNVSKPDYESDLEERCKDWIYYRNRAYKLGKEGDQKGNAEASRAMNQFYNDLRLRFSEKQISDVISRLEAAGYK